MDDSEVRRIHEALGQAMGREVLQLDLGVMLGLNLASVEVGKWETEGARGPEAVALSYLSQGLPGFRGDILPSEGATFPLPTPIGLHCRPLYGGHCSAGDLRGERGRSATWQCCLADLRRRR
jgi:hypothetical protein